MRKIACIFIWVACFLNGNLSAQNKVKIDSLSRVIKTSKTDTSVVLAYIELSYEYRKAGYSDTSKIYAQKAFDLSQKLKYANGIGRSLYYIGIAHFIVGDLDSALHYYSAARDTLKSIGDLKNYSSVLTAMGGLLGMMGDQTGAIDLHLECLRIKREIGDSLAMASALNNIGNVYHSMNQYDTALTYFSQAAVIHKRFGDYAKLTDDYFNMGNSLHLLKRDNEAWYYLKRSIQIADSVGYNQIQAYSYGLMASIFFDDKKLDSAEFYYRKALVIAEDQQDMRIMIVEYMHLANLFVERNQHEQAEIYLDKARTCAYQMDDLQNLQEVHRSYTAYFQKIKKWDSAFVHYELYVTYRDSLTDVDMQTEIARKQMKSNFEAQQKLERAEQDAKDAITEAKLQQQKIWIGLGSLVLLLAIAFAWFLYNRAQVTRRQNILIQQQKAEVETQRDQMEIQKSVIEEKNKSITDSITYARRIQQAILPQSDLMQRALRDSFVLYQPKDIVSGDFFWLSETEEYIFYATVDCTGHGVPGGFMSILGASLLNEIVNDHQVIEPSQVLNQMRDKVISALRQTGESGENKDGMDMVLCRIDKKTNHLLFSAANNPVWICRRGVITVYNPDKQPVGIGATSGVSFTSHSVSLEKGDIIYTFTDGFADQFGGDKGKKFKYKPLKELLQENSSMNMNDQHEKLLDVFIHWKGNLEQVDDVLIIGIKI